MRRRPVFVAPALSCLLACSDDGGGTSTSAGTGTGTTLETGDTDEPTSTAGTDAGTSTGTGPDTGSDTGSDSYSYRRTMSGPGSGRLSPGRRSRNPRDADNS